MILKFEIYARKLGRNIPVHMYLPDDYMLLQEDLPVLYMFDGHNLFYDEDATYGRSWRLIPHLENPDLPKMMVVGIECNHEGNQRLIEYAPFPFYDSEFGGSLPGEAWKTMHFIIHDLKPYIDAHFPAKTDRKNTFIGGSSCGGLMGLYGAYRYSSVFSKGLAISPYLTPSLSSLLCDLSKTYIRQPENIYFSWGCHEGHTAHEFIMETKAITEVSNLLIQKGCRLQFNMKVYGEHSEASWESEADEFLRFLLK